MKTLDIRISPITRDALWAFFESYPVDFERSGRLLEATVSQTRLEQIRSALEHEDFMHRGGPGWRHLTAREIAAIRRDLDRLNGQ